MIVPGDDEYKYVEKRCRSRQWVSRREERGAYYTLFKELAIEDSDGIAEYMRMPHGKFNKLLNIIGPSVQKKDTVMRNSILVREQEGKNGSRCLKRFEDELQ